MVITVKEDAVWDNDLWCGLVSMYRHVTAKLF
jgi:hypothetical protein